MVFLLQFKKSWNFHSCSRSENEKRSASTQKIIKNLKNQKIFINIFKKYGIFWVDALFHLFSDRLKLCFSQRKSHQIRLGANGIGDNNLTQAVSKNPTKNGGNDLTYP